jgi:hypothetical protein
MRITRFHYNYNPAATPSGHVDTVLFVKGVLAMFEIVWKIVSVRRSLLAEGNRAQEPDPAITG